MASAVKWAQKYVRLVMSFMPLKKILKPACFSHGRRGRSEAARQMHDAFAQHIWQAYGWRRLGRAAQHFVRGIDAQQFAKGVGLVKVWSFMHDLYFTVCTLPTILSIIYSVQSSAQLLPILCLDARSSLFWL